MLCASCVNWCGTQLLWSKTRRGRERKGQLLQHMDTTHNTWTPHTAHGHHIQHMDTTHNTWTPHMYIQTHSRQLIPANICLCFQVFLINSSLTLRLVYVDIFLQWGFIIRRAFLTAGLSHSVGGGCVGPSVSLCQFTGSHSMCVNTVLFCVGMWLWRWVQHTMDWEI